MKILLSVFLKENPAIAFSNSIIPFLCYPVRHAITEKLVQLTKQKVFSVIWDIV